MSVKRFLFWALILALVVLLNLPPPAVLRTEGAVRDSLAPFQNTLSLVISRGRRLLSRVGRTRLLLRERDALDARVAELEYRIHRLEHVESENATLRRQLGFSILSPHRLLLSEVIVRGDMSGWWQTVRLNKGRGDGVETGLAVMTAEGLIGRTMAVSSETCEVLLLTDPNCKVACKTAGAGTFGILRGAGVRLSGRPASLEMLATANPPIMNFISTGDAIREGDAVLTSGLGGIFPEGLPVGRVGRVRPHESGLYLQAEVAPSARLDTFRYAFIVLERQE